MKQYILETSIVISTACFIVDGVIEPYFDSVDISPEVIKGLLGKSSENFFHEYKLLMEFFTRYSKDKNVFSISEILYIERNFSILNQNSEILSNPSTFSKELFYFHYLSGYLSSNNEFNTCGTDLIMKQNFKFDIVNPQSQALAYINFNIISSFMDSIEIMVSKANTFIRDTLSKTKIGVEITNYAQACLAFLLCMFFFV